MSSRRTWFARPLILAFALLAALILPAPAYAASTDPVVSDQLGFSLDLADITVEPQNVQPGDKVHVSIAVEGETPWGFKIYVNDSWDVWFGGSDGILRYGADGCPLDASYAGSTCLFTVDLCKGTYKFEKQ